MAIRKGGIGSVCVDFAGSKTEAQAFAKSATERFDQYISCSHQPVDEYWTIKVYFWNNEQIVAAQSLLKECGWDFEHQWLVLGGNAEYRRKPIMDRYWRGIKEHVMSVARAGRIDNFLRDENHAS